MYYRPYIWGDCSDVSKTGWHSCLLQNRVLTWNPTTFLLIWLKQGSRTRHNNIIIKYIYWTACFKQSKSLCIDLILLQSSGMIKKQNLTDDYDHFSFLLYITFNRQYTLLVESWLYSVVPLYDYQGGVKCVLAKRFLWSFQIYRFSSSLYLYSSSFQVGVF